MVWRGVLLTVNTSAPSIDAAIQRPTAATSDSITLNPRECGVDGWRHQEKHFLAHERYFFAQEQTIRGAEIGAEIREKLLICPLPWACAGLACRVKSRAEGTLRGTSGRHRR